MEENKKSTGTFEGSSHDTKQFLKKFPGEIIPTSEVPDFIPTLLPDEFDHSKPEHASPMADEKLTSISERIHGHPDQASFIDLQQLVNVQKGDLLLQQNQFEKNNPEWNKQKDLLKFAFKQFKLPLSGTGNEVDLTVDISQPEPEITIGREPGKAAYKFKRNKILNQYAKSQAFEFQQKRFERVEEAALTMMEGQSPLSNIEKQDTIIYLTMERKRWKTKKEKAQPGTPEWATAKCNEDVIFALFEKVKKYPSEENPSQEGNSEITEDEMKLIENFANDDAPEMKPLIDDVITEAEEITRGTASKIDSNHHRKQEQPKRD